MIDDDAIHPDPTTRREAFVWVLASALATMAGRGLTSAARGLARHARAWLAGTAPRWQPLVLALIGVAIGGAWVRWPVAVGPEHVNAASEPGKSGPTPQDIVVDPLLQDGYADPAAVTDDRRAADDPMQALVPDSPALAPAGESLPVWTPSTVARWEDYIRAGAAPYGVDPTLVAIVMTIESAGNRNAGSKVGARSLMQVMPATASGIDRERGWPHDPAMINDPAANIDYGVYNLSWCMRTYGLAVDPDWIQTIGRACRCYNGGPSAVDAPYEESRDHDRWVTGMWAERHDASSPTFDEWRAAGGQRALDIAATVEGPPMDGPALPYVRPVAPGGPDHLDVLR